MENEAPTRRRRALLVATDSYGDPALGELRAPAGDVRALAAVLADPSIGDFEVRELVNETTEQVKEEIEGFFDEARLSDLLLLYVSGHGVLSQSRRLYFATCSTKLKRLRATAVEASFVHDVVHHSRARSIVFVLDCCHSGAFPQGLVPKSAPTVDAVPSFEGHGRVTLTASTELEYAFEEQQSSGDPTARDFPGSGGSGSLFTRYLVEGLNSGEADVNRDGVVSIDELYDYVYARVRARSTHQTPGKLGAGYGEIILAKSARGTLLPSELRQVIEHPLPGVRRAAIAELAQMRATADAGMAAAIAAALKRASADPDPRVAEAAAAALEPAPAPEPPRVAEAAAAALEPAPAPEPPREPDPTERTLGRRLSRALSDAFVRTGNREPGPAPAPDAPARADPSPPAGPEPGDEARTGGYVRGCPSCGREVAGDSDFCECGEYLRWDPDQSASSSAAPEQPTADGAMRTCSSCGQLNPADRDFCRVCGDYLHWEPDDFVPPATAPDEAEDAPRAQFNRAVALQDAGDLEGAQAALEQALASGDEDIAPRAAVNLGVLFKDRGELDRAQAALEQALRSGHPVAEVWAAYNLGSLRMALGDEEGAEAAYRRVIDSGDPLMMPWAAVGLGGVLRDRGDVERARAAYQQAIDSGHFEMAPKAAFQLARMLDDGGDPQAAQAAYRIAADSGSEEIAAAARAALNEGPA